MLKPKMKVWLFGDFPLTIGLFLGEASVNFPWGNVSITIGFFMKVGFWGGIWWEYGWNGGSQPPQKTSGKSWICNEHAWKRFRK